MHAKVQLSSGTDDCTTERAPLQWKTSLSGDVLAKIVSAQPKAADQQGVCAANTCMANHGASRINSRTPRVVGHKRSLHGQVNVGTASGSATPSDRERWRSHLSERWRTGQTDRLLEHTLFVCGPIKVMATLQCAKALETLQPPRRVCLCPRAQLLCYQPP
jgi:hypothetical protein